MLAALILILVVLAVGVFTVGAGLGAGRFFMPRGQSPVGLIVGLMCAGILFGVVAGLGAYIGVRKIERDTRRGWNLVPVVVVAQEVPAGTPLTFDMISQRSIPEQFVTSSVVKPADAAQIIGRRLIGPLQAGDPLLWVLLQPEGSSAAAPGP